MLTVSVFIAPVISLTRSPYRESAPGIKYTSALGIKSFDILFSQIENWYSMFSPKNPPYPDLIDKYFHPQVTLSLWPLPEGTSIIWML